MLSATQTHHMRIELTVRHRERSYDVAIQAPADTSLGAIRAAFGSLCTAEQTPRLWLGGTALRDDAAWSRVGLRRGSTVSTTPDTGRERSSAALSLNVVGGPFAGHAVPLGRSSCTIGRGPACGVVLDDPDTSRLHAAIAIDGTTVTVRDLGSTNGTTLDGVPVGAAGAALEVGSCLRIGDNALSLRGPEGPPAVVSATEDGRVRVIRPPRRTHPPVPEPITVAAPTVQPRPRPVQWLAALLPAAMGVALVWITGSLQFLLFALLSPAMVLGGALGDRVHWRRSRRRTAATAAAVAAGLASRIDAALRTETEARRRSSPDPSSITHIAGLPTDRVWERGRADDDFLVVRLGTAGLPSMTQLTRDGRSEPAGQLADVPMCVDLRDGPLGLAGPAGGLAGCARAFIGQLLTLHSPVDLELALLVGPSVAPRWRWARWAPHLRTQTMTVAGRADLIDSLTARIGQRSAAASGTWRSRWTVLVLDGTDELEDLAGLTAVLRAGPAIGVTAVVLAADGAALPAVCASVACVQGESGTHLALRRHGIPAPQVVLADQVDEPWADAVGRALAPLVDPGADDLGALPAICTLADVHGELGTDSISAGWAASAGLARARIGIGGDGVVELDLTTDGPHVLIAGTTGSGKSEFLQALVVGLALAQSPTELTFLLVDYKGGAAFGDCARLPHTAGLVTDLDPYLTGRALRSLRSELRRREGLLGSVGATDLAAYRRSPTATPLPRLVIVVDEFAALAEELPEFVQGLVAVAQRGRSLGVHLVLATQRPGNAVSAEIRANTGLRIALRVTDATESSDVIDTADAAHLARATPGRAYVRTGSTLRCLQSAWPGAHTPPTDEAVRVDVLDEWLQPARRPEEAQQRTDLSRLVDSVSTAASRAGLPSVPAPWAPPLPQHLDHHALPSPPRTTDVPFGLVDLPDEQRQSPITLDLLEAESLLVVGAPRSGRTTALETIAIAAAGQLPPDRLDLYSVDVSGTLAATVSALPHSATVLAGSDVELILRLLTLLERECTERARIATPAGDRSHALLLIDGWDAIADLLTDAEAARLTDHLGRLLRVASSGGLAVVVSGGRSVLAPRVSGGFARRIVLRLADVADYAAFGISPRQVPASLPAGRGLRAEDGASLQIAVTGTDGGSASTTAQAVTNRWSQEAVREANPATIRLRPLPSRVLVTELISRQPGRTETADGRHAFVLGVAGDAATPLWIDLVRHPGQLIVAGPPRSGRSTLLRLLHRQARALGLTTIIAAGPRSPLADVAREESTTVLSPDDGIDSVRLPGTRPCLVLVDDSELWVDSSLGQALSDWLRRGNPQASAVVVGRSDDLATTYRGLGAQARRSQRGILLRPGPIDGELLGVRLPRRPSTGPPGRGVMVGDPSWDPRFDSGEPVPVQIADL